MVEKFELKVQREDREVQPAMKREAETDRHDDPRKLHPPLGDAKA